MSFELLRWFVERHFCVEEFGGIVLVSGGNLSRKLHCD